MGRGRRRVRANSKAIVQPLPFSYHCSMARVNSHFLRFLFFFLFFFPCPHLESTVAAAGHVSDNRKPVWWMRYWFKEVGSPHRKPCGGRETTCLDRRVLTAALHWRDCDSRLEWKGGVKNSPNCCTSAAQAREAFYLHKAVWEHASPFVCVLLFCP